MNMHSDRMVDYNEICGFLNHLNSEELKQVLNDDSKLEDIIKDLKQAKDIESEKELLIASNRSLAEYNLKREPELRAAKTELRDMARMGEALYKSYEEKLNFKGSKHDLDSILCQLKLAASEMEEESEKIAENFLNGDLDVDGFIEQFATRRKIMHLRRVKSDKMAELMTRRGETSSNPFMQGNPNASMNCPYPQLLYQPPPPPAAVPYPVGNSITAMPLPTPYMY